MKEPLPDIDPNTAATDPAAQQRYNESLIEHYRTNAGELTGQFAALPVLLLNTIGAKTGAARTTPLVYLMWWETVCGTCAFRRSRVAARRPQSTDRGRLSDEAAQVRKPRRNAQEMQLAGLGPISKGDRLLPS